MKKSIKRCIIVILIIILLILCIFVGIRFYLMQPKMSQSETNGNSYYTVTYKANYETYNLLNNNEKYEIVTNKNRLNEILKKVKSSYSNKFKDDFFKEQNLLVIQAKIDPQIDKLDIDNTSADVIVYMATPLTTTDQDYDFSVYLVPIGKDVKNCNVQVMAYPDRMY